MSIKCILKFTLFAVNFIFWLVKGFLKTPSNIAQPLFSTSNFYLIGWVLFCIGFSQLLVFEWEGEYYFLFTNLCQILINSVMAEEKRKQSK